MKRNSLFATLFILGCLCFTQVNVQAQTRSNVPLPSSNSNRDAPFDGGLSLLVAAGTAYALKRAHNKKKKAEATATTEK